eukprot:2121906-Rhodomonas_salina.2
MCEDDIAIAFSCVVSRPRVCTTEPHGADSLRVSHRLAKAPSVRMQPQAPPEFFNPPSVQPFQHALTSRNRNCVAGCPLSAAE